MFVSILRMVHSKNEADNTRSRTHTMYIRTYARWNALRMAWYCKKKKTNDRERALTRRAPTNLCADSNISNNPYFWMVHSYLKCCVLCRSWCCCFFLLSYLWRLSLNRADYSVCVLFFFTFALLCLALLLSICSDSLHAVVVIHFIFLLRLFIFSKLVNVKTSEYGLHSSRSYKAHWEETKKCFVRIYSSVNQWRVSVCIELQTECGIKSLQFPGQWIKLLH